MNRHRFNNPATDKKEKKLCFSKDKNVEFKNFASVRSLVSIYSGSDVEVFSMLEGEVVILNTNVNQYCYLT